MVRWQTYGLAEQVVSCVGVGKAQEEKEGDDNDDFNDDAD